ncbi:SDR family NAD(P)-dependent oxidoreductase, partial [Mitsuokella multacida]|uniref:SDR family NAD(P)-dependent oxidoreductase n=1 Tax=Mitsuokella multacida TaxID=52226 RepID=UPI00242F6337
MISRGEVCRMKRIAVITGASSGLGREFARLLAHEAVDEFWLVARREERLWALAAEVALPCRVFALDLTQESALEELSAALSAEPVTVRWLVNAAGFGRIGMAADIGAATTGRMIALNC